MCRSNATLWSCAHNAQRVVLLQRHVVTGTSYKKCSYASSSCQHKEAATSVATAPKAACRSQLPCGCCCSA